METKDNDTLADTVHKCLRCNEVAFEYEKDKFRCADSECQFEWIVKRSE